MTNKQSNTKTKTGNKKGKLSKKQIRRKKAIRFRKEHPIRYRLRFVLKLLVLAGLCASFILILLFYARYGKDLIRMSNQAREVVAASSEETFKQSQTSLVYDTKGNVISELKGEKDVHYLEYQDIPRNVIDAFISIEDKKFLEHGGIDIKANIRAALVLIKNKGEIKQGASTITQQLSRNIFLSHKVSYERKVEEIFIAREMEKKYEKWQILEFYINNIYFANGYYGIEAASEGYFSKDVKDLTLSEVAFLCAIPNNPTLYNPNTNYENTIKRRDRILYQMYKDKKISNEHYQEACEEKIKLKIKTIKKKNYIETFVTNSATKALMKEQGFIFRYDFESEQDKKEYDKLYSEVYDECQQSLNRAGYRIYTSINLSQQKKLQDSLDENLKSFTEKGKDGMYELQGAAVCIDNKTGYVTAIVGGRGQKTQGYTLNRAFQSYRQPGSSIKPLIVYTPAFENGYYKDDVVVDEKFEGGPRNSDGRYLGKITIQTAVEKSKNTIAWKLFEEMTPKICMRYLKRMSFARISDNDYFPSASLGGFTNGVSPIEMAAGYATIENDGIYREPTCIIKIEDAEGREIVSEHRNDYQVYDKNAARMMTDVLQGVLKHGTGRGLALPNMPSAGKTGTTNDKKDGWFVGYTPYYTTSVWVGCDTPKTIHNLMGSTYPGHIWYDYMKEIHEGLERVDFTKYTDYRSKAEKDKVKDMLKDEEPQKDDTLTDEEGGLLEEDTPPALDNSEDAQDSLGTDNSTDSDTTDKPEEEPTDDLLEPDEAPKPDNGEDSEVGNDSSDSTEDNDSSGDTGDLDNSDSPNTDNNVSGGDDSAGVVPDDMQ